MNNNVVKDIIKRTLIQMKTVFVLLEHGEWGEKVLYTGKTKEQCLIALNMTEEQFQNQLEFAIHWNSRELRPFEDNNFHLYYTIESYSLSKLFEEMIDSFDSLIAFYSDLLKKEREQKAKSEKEMRVNIINEMIQKMEEIKVK